MTFLDSLRCSMFKNRLHIHKSRINLIPFPVSLAIKPDVLRRKGFTLLEVMFSVAIVSVATVTVINSFSFIARSKKSASDYTKAILLLQEKMADFQAGILKEDVKNGKFDSPFEEFSWDVRYAPLPGSLKKSYLVVSWKERGRKKQLAVDAIVPERNK